MKTGIVYLFRPHARKLDLLPLPACRLGRVEVGRGLLQNERGVGYVNTLKQIGHQTQYRRRLHIPPYFAFVTRWNIAMLTKSLIMNSFPQKQECYSKTATNCSEFGSKYFPHLVLIYNEEPGQSVSNARQRHCDKIIRVANTDKNGLTLSMDKFLKPARVATVIIFLALVRCLSEPFRLQYYSTGALGFETVKPFIIGALVAAIGLFAMNLLSFWKLYKWTLVTGCLAFLALLLVKYLYLP